MAKVLILGATGLFGGHLARQLAPRADISLTIAGRRAAPLEKLAQDLGVAWVQMDRDDPDTALNTIKPFAVIDCSGPFQAYGAAPYIFAQAVLNAGAHYLDIADAPDFACGIASLDVAAKAYGLTAWSGASTTPAITSAIAADLVQGLDTIDLIETAILPGNKTPRGLSVMRAILGQVGQSFVTRRAGQSHTAIGWSDTTQIAPQVGAIQLNRRRAARVNTADTLLARHCDARTVTARAGLELGLFHDTLRLARHLPFKLERFAKPLLRAANLFKRFGSDAGGMRVRVVGRIGPHIQTRIWDMIIPDGHGPKTPVQPVVILLDGLLNGHTKPGAAPAIKAFTRQQAEAQLAQIGAIFERRDTPHIPIFVKSLGDTFQILPDPVKALHRPAHLMRFTGEAQVETATYARAKLAAFIGGFPLTGGTVPAQVDILAEDNSETWTRTMGGKTFRSSLRYKDGKMTETFGPLTFDLDLHVQDGALKFPVSRGKAFGLIPVPRVLTPVSETSETADDQGRFHFDVRLSLPNGALIVHYKGHLAPA